MAAVLDDQIVRFVAGISDGVGGAKRRKRRAFGRAAALFALIAALLGAVAPATAVEVVFPDSALEASVRHALSLPTGPIADTDMASLESLGASADSNLQGLQYGVNLNSLGLTSWGVSDFSPIAGLDKLETLALTGCQISASAPLAGLTGLTTLSLNQSIVHDFSPIAAIPNLYRLETNAPDVKDPSTLATLTNIRELVAPFSFNFLYDLTPISGLTNLTTLNLGDSAISDISPLAGLINLEVLDLTYNPLTDFSALAGLTKLKELRLDNNARVSILDFSGFSLTSLHTLSCAIRFNGVSLRNATLGQTGFNALMDGGEVADHSAYGIAEIGSIESGYYLRTLDLGGIDFADISDLSKMYTADGLEELSFAGATNLDGGQVVALTSELDLLHWLDVRGAWESFDTPTREALSAWDAIEGNTLVTVPEPGTLCLLLSLLLLGGCWRRR